LKLNPIPPMVNTFFHRNLMGLIPVTVGIPKWPLHP
jgi:hypothetical protein